LLAVSYLPTAERLTINVMKLRDIKFIPTVLSLNKFSKYYQCYYSKKIVGIRTEKNIFNLKDKYNVRHIFYVKWLKHNF